MQIFTFSDEIDVIRCFLDENSSVKAIKSKMAAAAGCQLSYLSQVMARKVQLTPDQGFGICKFLRLNKVETEYFMQLVHLKRAGTREHRAYLKNRMTEFKKRKFNLKDKIISEAEVSDAILQQYSNDWRMQAVHMYLTIPRYQSLAAVTSKLRLDELDTLAVLNALVAAGLAKKNGNLWTPILKDLHVPVHSPHSVATHFQWKMRSLQDLQKTESTGVHFAGTFSLSVNDIEEIKAMVIDFIVQCRTLALASPEEEVAHLGLSFFSL